jgi:hypothetical protein
MGSSRLSDVSASYSAAGSSRSVEIRRKSSGLRRLPRPSMPRRKPSWHAACAHRPANHTISTDSFALIIPNPHQPRASGSASPQGPCSGHQCPKPSTCRSAFRRRATAGPRVPRLAVDDPYGSIVLGPLPALLAPPTRSWTPPAAAPAGWARWLRGSGKES